MNTPDHNTLARAVEDARRILQEHIELGSLDATRTLEQVVVVLDRADVLFALGRVKRRRAMPLAESQKKPVCQPAAFARAHPGHRARWTYIKRTPGTFHIAPPWMVGSYRLHLDAVRLARHGPA